MNRWAWWAAAFNSSRSTIGPCIVKQLSVQSTYACRVAVAANKHRSIGHDGVMEDETSKQESLLAPCPAMTALWLRNTTRVQSFYSCSPDLYLISDEEKLTGHPSSQSTIINTCAEKDSAVPIDCIDSCRYSQRYIDENLRYMQFPSVIRRSSMEWNKFTGRTVNTWHARIQNWLQKAHVLVQMR